MYTRLIGRAAALVGVLALSSCATIISGSQDEVKIDSKPQGAQCEVYKAGDIIARVKSTPETVMVKRSGKDLRVHCALHEQPVVASLDTAGATKDLRGVETIDSGYNGWSMLNFLMVPALPLMITGLLIDGFSGAGSGYDDAVVEMK